MILCANPLAQYRSHRQEIDAAVSRVLASDRYILGPEVDALEREFADYIGTHRAIGVANGTDALELALRGLDIGIGDEVITVSHTAVATVAAIEATGATAVLVDVDATHFTLDATQLAEVRTSRTRAVIAVHLYGQSADLDSIGAFCDRHGLSLIEDVSQAHGATWKGRRLGSIGRVGCFSCYPTKNLGAVGDAGLITTNDETLALKIRMLREYGWQQRYVSDIAGRNSRLDELQAAILRVKLRHLDTDNGKRVALAARYTEALRMLPVRLPESRKGAAHVFHLYVIRIQERQRIIDYLMAHGIAPGVHYHMPIHLQPAYRGRLRTAASMRVTESLADDVLSLPLYPEVGDDELTTVVRELRAALSAGAGG